ncbi:Swarming motility protein ybiA [Sphingobacterium spiritivorum]|uniref:Swarming motility protein ybiA n=1 Tax=Sphingobacterium spiritivorum TaxID=258 RepID=A0A380C9T7_SPHSI|nr:NADAR family protein [Sphingobacterium spiritivorum]SUJ16218.1 Swarming motility protein ybiA [Sphingobacterium spiritivorum]
MTLSRRKYLKQGSITFKSTKGKFGALSNMAPNFPVTINSLTIRNIEALYQALKFPHKPDIQSQIINSLSPITSKKISRNFNNYVREDWDNVRFKIMKFCIDLKYSHNPESFGSIIKSTGKKNIVEFTIEDKVWGATDEGEFYEGTNALGRLLMDLRLRIIKEEFTMEIPTVSNLKLLNEEIKDVHNKNIQKTIFD